MNTDFVRFKTSPMDLLLNPSVLVDPRNLTPYKNAVLSYVDMNCPDINQNLIKFDHEEFYNGIVLTARYKYGFLSDAYRGYWKVADGINIYDIEKLLDGQPAEGFTFEQPEDMSNTGYAIVMSRIQAAAGFERIYPH